ncbi:MAG: glycosyltransferase [Stenomitos frigidus ULC029]
MRPNISVIVCTHNPRHDYLKKVITALQEQTLSPDQWELLLIDNASTQSLATEVDLSWHPNARHIREDQLGLTPARLRGIREAQAETLIFVDDDNVLNSDYLEVALHLSKNFPFLGAWGGQIRGEFEVSPPDWAESYLPLLAIREFDQDKWSNLPHQHETTPCGAGICIRKAVADKYAELVINDPKRANLDRKGNQLMSCGDSDMAFTACDLDLGTGQFVALKLAHLMPANRVSEDYLTRLAAGIAYSLIILNSFRGQMPKQSSRSLKAKFLEFTRLLMMHPVKRRIHKMTKKAEALATQEVLQTQT